MNVTKPNAGNRLGSMVIDHFAMTMIATLFAVPGMITKFSKAFEVSHDPQNFDFFTTMDYFGLIGFAIYFCKDSFNGQSFGKRASKLQVIVNATGQVASPLRCMVRNLFCVVWPLEVLITLFQPDRRIGDLVAGTRVITIEGQPQQAPFNFTKAFLAVLIVYASMLILFILPVQLMISSFSGPETKFVERSINEAAAQKTAQLYTDSLGYSLSADVKVYDQLQADKNLKYVSVILYLEDNLLEDEKEFAALEEKSTELLYSQFPEYTFVGKIKFIYKEPGHMQSRTIPFEFRNEPGFTENTIGQPLIEAGEKN